MGKMSNKLPNKKKAGKPCSKVQVPPSLFLTLCLRQYRAGPVPPLSQTSCFPLLCCPGPQLASSRLPCGSRWLLQLHCHVSVTGGRGEGKRYTSAKSDPLKGNTRDITQQALVTSYWLKLVIWAPCLQGRPGNVDLFVHLLFRAGHIATPRKIGIPLLRRGKWVSGRQLAVPLVVSAVSNLHGSHPG